MDTGHDEWMDAINTYYQATVKRWKTRERRAVWKQNKIKGFVLAVLRPVLRSVYFIRKVWNQTRKYGPAVRDKEGVSMLKQVVQQVKVTFQTHLSIFDYYQFMLYRDKNRLHAGFFIHHHQMHVLLNSPPYQISDYESSTLKNKVQFYEHFSKHDLPTIPILAVFDRSNVDYREWCRGNPLPSKDLFSKPLDLDQGIGARRWSFCEKGQYSSDEGQTVDTTGLIRALQDQSKQIETPVLLQERFSNHPALEILTGKALCTARIVTGRNPTEGTEAEFLLGMMKLPVGEGPVANLSAGSLGVAIDSSGCISRASYKDPGRIMEAIETHPDTGKEIIGFELPYWESSISLAVRAHQTLPNIPFVGWDIAITEDGPVLIEGNVGFGAESLQITTGHPLGKTKFAAYYSEYLN